MHMKRLKSKAGLIVRGQRGNPVVRKALVRFARWARANQDFPVRVPVYLNAKEKHLTLENEWVCASFFAPYSRRGQPYIRIATGDYPKLLRARGRNDALAAIIMSFCHELVHYRQWVETGTITERGVLVRARAMLQQYADFARTP